MIGRLRVSASSRHHCVAFAADLGHRPAHLAASQADDPNQARRPAGGTQIDLGFPATADGVDVRRLVIVGEDDERSPWARWTVGIQIT